MINKIIEELEDAKFAGFSDKVKCFNEGIDKAIEIVKKKKIID